MRYRSFGRKIDWQPSALGFGCMRLPVIGEDRSRIDEPEATRMVRYAIDHGVNYLDTAYGYHGGHSEGFVGRALEDGYRAKVRVATKSPTWLLEKPGDFDRYLGEQLDRLQADYIDFYLLHGLGRERWKKVLELGILDSAERAKAAGKFRHFGFSFHDDLRAFEAILRGYDGWDFCQIQYNFIDTEYQAGTAGLRLAAEDGLGVVIMEPLRGGSLVQPGPADVETLWGSAHVRRTKADWALQWLWNQPQVSLVLSGMSTMQQVTENVGSAGRSSAGTMPEGEVRFLARVRESYLRLRPFNCTGCAYCMPCPQGIKIPNLLDAYNNAQMFGTPERFRLMYGRLPENERADACQACGECEASCPQGLPIREYMKTIHAACAADNCPQDDHAG